MNLGQLKTLVSVNLDDLDFGYFTQSQVTRWINNALYECQKVLIQSGENWYLKCLQTTCIAGQSEYVLPEDFLKVNRVQIIQNPATPGETRTQIFSIVLSQAQILPTNNAYPGCYYLKKNKLVLLPPPDSNYVLRLDYTYRVTEMSEDTDIPDVPEQYHEYLAVLACIDGFLRDDRNPVSLLAKKAWYEKAFKEDAEDRKIDSPRSVVVTKEDDYWYGAY